MSGIWRQDSRLRRDFFVGIESIEELVAESETDDGAGGDFGFDEGFGVTSEASIFVAGVEDAEVCDFDGFAVFEGFGNLVKNKGDVFPSLLGGYSAEAVTNRVDQLTFNHVTPFLIEEHKAWIQEFNAGEELSVAWVC